MRDLVDIHRANIAKAGVMLSERIAEATAEYSAQVAASEATLIVSMDRRLRAFNGEQLAIEDQRTEGAKVKDDEREKKRIDAVSEVVADRVSALLKSPD